MYKLPFEYDNQLIKLKARINNTPIDYSFILDSGAPTIISDSIVLKNHLNYVDSKLAYDANGLEQTFDLYKIKHFSISNKSFENVKVISNEFVTQIPAVKGRANGGLIGANLMDNTIWMIDYLKKEITVTDVFDSLRIPENSFSTTMFKNENGNPMIDVTLSDSKKIPVMIDLGFNGSVLLPHQYFNNTLFNDSLNLVKKQKVSTGFGSDEKEVKYQFIKGFKSGELNEINVKSSIGNSDALALIGNDFLQNYTIIMDFIHNQMIFIPRDKSCDNTMC